MCGGISSTLQTLLVVTCLFFSPVSVMASSLFYAISPNGTSDKLVAFDKESLTVSYSIDLKLNGNAPIFQTNSIAFNHDGDLYGWSAWNPVTNSGMGQLYTIDLITGNISMIGQSNGGPYYINGMTFDQSGSLFGLAGELYDINPDTGIKTQISTGGVGQGHRGLAIDFLTDELYAWTAGQGNAKDALLRVDKATGAYTEVALHGEVPLGGSVGVEFDPDSRALLTVRNGYKLYSTDILSGDVSYLGAVKHADGTPLQTTSLAVRWSESAEPVPEPGTLFLLGSGLAGLAGMHRRKMKKK